MRLLLSTLLIIGSLTAVANAGQSCSWVGKFWVCNGGGAGGQSCSWVGKFWVCN